MTLPLPPESPTFGKIHGIGAWLGVLALSSSAFCVGAEGILEEYAKKAILSVETGSIPDGMTNLRIGINSHSFKPETPSEEVQKGVQAAIDGERDGKKKAALMVIQSVLFLVVPDKKENAIKLLDEAQRLDGTLPEVYNTRAILLMAKGQHEGALADFTKAIELNPSYVDALVNRAILYRAMKQPEKAVADSIRYQTLLGEVINKKP